jgi:hypothetical protein
VITRRYYSTLLLDNLGKASDMTKAEKIHTEYNQKLSLPCCLIFSYILWPPLEGRALHSQECFLPPRRGFNLRCTRERYILKNVFFLHEKILIYDAPSLPRKDNRFDQKLLSIGGSKVWRKGCRPVAWP